AYELVFLACLVALSPFTGFVWLLGVPIGIWAIIILSKRRVRAAFELSLRKKAGLANWRPTPVIPAASVPFRRPRRSFLRSFWTMFFTTPRDRSELSAREHS